MVWPEFVSETADMLSDGVMPRDGTALMFIVDPEPFEFHRARIKIGVRGYFVEGSHQVGECTVS